MALGPSADPGPEPPVGRASRVGLEAPTAAVEPVDGKYHTVPGTLLLLLLAGLALLDRSAALLSIPGVPIYPAEIVLGIGLAFLAAKRRPFRGVNTGRWFAPIVLAIYMGWGLTKLVSSLHYPILDVVRDSALVYYSLFAVLAIGLSNVDSRFNPPELLRLFGRLVPWFLLIAPFRLIGAALFGPDGPTIPGSDVSFFGSHRLGNLGAMIGLTVVYLASSGRRDRATIVGIVSGIIMLVIIGTQNRGGMIAGGAAILYALLLWSRRIKLRLGWVVAVLAAVLVLAWGLDVTVHTKTRAISVSQLSNNLTSLTGSTTASDRQLGDTVDFREQLWHLVLARTIETNQLENGWGFGPNLGSDFLPTHQDRALRNPHNSHITILVRLGLVGLGIWIMLWLSWFYGVYQRARTALRRRWPPDDHGGRLALLAGAGIAAILVNAFVDPTLETPMVAVWLWSLFAFGVLAVADGRPPRTPRPIE